MSGKHILIIGTGSAGQRHARNFHSLGCRISCMDPRADRLDELNKEIELAGKFAILDEAFDNSDGIDGVAVTSPPVFHVEQCLAAIERKIPVMLEKPVSPDLESAKRLQSVVNAGGTPLLLGYTYRWWPPLEKVRELLIDNSLGKLRYVNFVMSAHLADWHPWEDYRDFFMASKKLGGGALLDESHWLDLMLWFLGQPETVTARIEKISDLRIDTDDNVDMIISYKDDLRVTMHLDLYGRPHQKYIRFIGEGGTILWTIDPNQVAICREMEEKWVIHKYDCERNDMFLSVDQEFLDVIEGSPVKTCHIDDGVKVLEIIEAARRSNSEGGLTKVHGRDR
ncbi:MAG: Gfo/Idh/MocA family oxidoreductase [Deltaproteobacteria bacterium]|nr:Gfo/Idh/MocA family oxidoreductase [Deltaproteobacteria bacterium]